MKKMLRLAVRRRVRSKDLVTGKCIYKIVYKPTRCLRKIPMKEFDLNVLRGTKRWYVDGKTGEAVITRKNVLAEIVRILDPMWLVNMKIEDLKKMKRHSLQYTDDTRTLAMQYIRVVKFSFKTGVYAGSDFYSRD
ncbi:hypothetical protein Hanom_Chr17g01574041 [Helianthus anomalus]